jgi:hypothetical protein
MASVPSADMPSFGSATPVRSLPAFRLGGLNATGTPSRFRPLAAARQSRRTQQDWAQDSPQPANSAPLAKAVSADHSLVTRVLVHTMATTKQRRPKAATTAATQPTEPAADGQSSSATKQPAKPLPQAAFGRSLADTSPPAATSARRSASAQPQALTSGSSNNKAAAASRAASQLHPLPPARARSSRQDVKKRS